MNDSACHERHKNKFEWIYQYLTWSVIKEKSTSVWISVCQPKVVVFQWFSCKDIWFWKNFLWLLFYSTSTGIVRRNGAIALWYPPRVRVRATAKLTAVFFHDESPIIIGGYESAIAPKKLSNYVNALECT